MHSDAKLISENWRIVWRKIQGLKPTARSGQITKDAEKGLILTIFDQKRVLDHIWIICQQNHHSASLWHAKIVISTLNFAHFFTLQQGEDIHVKLFFQIPVLKPNKYFSKKIKNRWISQKKPLKAAEHHFFP